MKKSKCGGMACAFNTSKIHQEDCEHFLKGFFSDKDNKPEGVR